MRNLSQTEKDEQLNLKRQYKGYNPEELYNYIYNKRGLPFDNLLLADFQKIVEQFKNEQLSQRYISMQVSKEKDKQKSSELLVQSFFTVLLIIFQHLKYQEFLK